MGSPSAARRQWPAHGCIAAALLYTFVVAKGAAPTTEHGDPQASKAAGDQTLATAADNTATADGSPEITDQRP